MIPVWRKCRAISMIALVLVASIAATGCAIKMLGDPDEDFVKQVYAFNKQVMTFMVGLQKKLVECGIEKPGDINPDKPCVAASYKENRTFYLETVPLGQAELRLRAEANPPNDKTIRWIDYLETLLDQLQAQHMKGALVPRYVDKKRREINYVFVQILLRERAKSVAQGK